LRAIATVLCLGFGVACSDVGAANRSRREPEAPVSNARAVAAAEAAVLARAPAATNDTSTYLNMSIRSPERVTHRFLGRLEEAEIEAPRLSSASREIAARGMLAPDPLSRLPAGLAPLARKVTLPGAREKAEFEMREALFAPPPFRATWRLEPPKGAAKRTLRFETARVPGVTYAIDVVVGGARRRLFRHAGGAQRTPWHPHEVALDTSGAAAALSFVAEGRGHGFFGMPRLFERSNEGPPSVVLIAVDTLSAEVVGFSGSERRLSPKMDALAQSGVSFRDAITNANWTRASTLSMFASEYSSAMGINVHSWWLDRARRRSLYARFDGMLPELLKRAGYTTAAIVNNLFILGYHSAGVEVGFERVTDYRTDHRDTPDVTAATLEFIARHRHEPFFLFVNLNTPHHPYTPPARYLRGIERRGERLHPEHKRYLGEVAFSDDYVGRIVRALEQHGLRERTLVVLTADHGEGLREDIAYTNVAIGRYSRFTHTVNLYDEVTRVPLAFSRPADIPGKRVIREQVRLLDVAPTILGLVGLRAHAQHRGVDLSAAILGRGEVPRDLPAFTEGKKCSSLRWKGHKYIQRDPGFELIARRREGGVARRVPEELYAVATDPRELRDLTTVARDVLRDFRAAHRAWRKEMSKGVRPRRVEGEMASRALDPPPTVVAAVSTGKSPGARSLEPAGTTTRTYLLLTSAREPHSLSGRVRARGGRITRFRLRNSGDDDAVWQRAGGVLDFRLLASGGEDRISFDTDPSDAPLELDLRLDGKPVDARSVLAGPFGLPLFESPLRLDARTLSWLDAREPPMRRAGELRVFLWRSRVEGTAPRARPDAPASDAPAPENDESLDRDVESALRGWGYIQAGDKVLK
jgi:arylsulfatase A-like enzyme